MNLIEAWKAFERRNPINRWLEITQNLVFRKKPLNEFEASFGQNVPKLPPDWTPEKYEPECEREEATIVTSQFGQLHKVLIDIDMNAVLLDSSTEGHYHLYIDHAMTWEDYKKLLIVMGQVGLLSPGYVLFALDRKYTSLRVPWVFKGDEPVLLDQTDPDPPPF